MPTRVGAQAKAQVEKPSSGESWCPQHQGGTPTDTMSCSLYERINRAKGKGPKKGAARRWHC